VSNTETDGQLTPSSPLLAGLHCASEYAKLPHKWSSLLKKEGAKSYPRLARSFAKESLANKALVGTTMAIDVLQGGVKVNALPEIVTVLINFRIDFSESVASTQHHVADILAKVAKKFKLRLSAFDDKKPSELGQSYIKVENFGPALEPAPLTPTDNGVWELFAGTVKATYPGPDGRERIVAPWATTGNTDCKMYYNLTKNVYRYSGGREGSKFMVGRHGPCWTLGYTAHSQHTVDERALIDAHFDIVAWIHAIVQNADAYTGEE
jgi:Gly-Xaa carboxypeptidase